MYRNGSFVILRESKTFDDGADMITLPGGTAGMIVQVRRIRHGQPPEYVVEFGAYGQVNCYHSELDGQDVAGLEVSEDGEERIAPRIMEPLTLPTIPFRINPTGVFTQEYGSGGSSSSSDSSEHSEDEGESKEMPIVVDFEADLARRAAEIESGSI